MQGPLNNNILPRFEFKFLVTKNIGEDIINDLSYFMKFDKHAPDCGYYYVKSLYYDTIDLNDYVDVIEGEKVRKKIRLRSYNNSLDSVSFEIKKKNNKIISKDRFKMNLDTAHKIVANPWDFSDTEFSTLANYFASEKRSPNITTCYSRLPLQGMLTDTVRVTLDFDFRSGPSELFYRTINVTDQRILPSHIAILEVKLDNRMPMWLKNVLQKYELSAQSYSKYTNAIDRIYGNRMLIDEIVSSTSEVQTR